MMSPPSTEPPLSDRIEALSAEVRALKQEVARLKKGVARRTWWLLALSLVSLALFGYIGSSPGFMTASSETDPGSVPGKGGPPAASTKPGGPRAPNQNDPDYGESLLLSLQKRAKAKRVNVKGVTRWCNSLPRNEREAVLMISLSEAMSAGDVAKVVRDGFGSELRSVVNILENDLKTPTALTVAENLRELLPFIRVASSPLTTAKDPTPGAEWQGAEDERRSRVNRINLELKPLAPALRKDVDHYFYWRWKMEGETFWD